MKKAVCVVAQRRLTVWERDTMRRECAPAHAASSCAWRNSGSRYRRAFDQQRLAPATRRRRECELGGSEFVGAVSTVASGCTRMCLWQNCGKRRAPLGAPRMRGTAASRCILLPPQSQLVWCAIPVTKTMFMQPVLVPDLRTKSVPILGTKSVPIFGNKCVLYCYL